MYVKFFQSETGPEEKFKYFFNLFHENALMSVKKRLKFSFKIDLLCLYIATESLSFNFTHTE